MSISQIYSLADFGHAGRKADVVADGLLSVGFDIDEEVRTHPCELMGAVLGHRLREVFHMPPADEFAAHAAFSSGSVLYLS